MTETTPETNPLDDLDTVAQHLAFWNRNQGETFVRELLAHDNAPVPAKPWLLSLEERVKIKTRERHEDTARELESRDLKRLARIVRKHAEGRPSEIDLPPYAPGSTNHKDWLTRMKRREKH